MAASARQTDSSLTPGRRSPIQEPRARVEQARLNGCGNALPLSPQTNHLQAPFTGEESSHEVLRVLREPRFVRAIPLGQLRRIRNRKMCIRVLRLVFALVVNGLVIPRSPGRLGRQSLPLKVHSRHERDSLCRGPTPLRVLGKAEQPWQLRDVASAPYRFHHRAARGRVFAQLPYLLTSTRKPGCPERHAQRQLLIVARNGGERLDTLERRGPLTQQDGRGRRPESARIVGRPKMLGNRGKQLAALQLDNRAQRTGTYEESLIIQQRLQQATALQPMTRGSGNSDSSQRGLHCAKQLQGRATSDRRWYPRQGGRHGA